MTVFPGREAALWWRELQPRNEPGRHTAGDRGALARLRRCATVMDAASEPVTLRLCRTLGVGEAGLERAALVAAVLAHVRDDRPGLTVARQVGVQKNDTALMSDLRFRRLLQADTPDEQLVGFRRLVALAGRTLPIADLAAGVWHWADEATRRRWIYAYHDSPDFQATAEAASPITEDTQA